MEILIIIFAIIGFFTLSFSIIYVSFYFWRKTQPTKHIDENNEAEILIPKTVESSNDEFNDARKQIEKEIREAYIFLRKENNTIPSETLEFMKDSSIEKLHYNELPIKDLVKRLNDAISIIPTGEMRNLLCDVNIILQTVDNN